MVLLILGVFLFFTAATFCLRLKGGGPIARSRSVGVQASLWFALLIGGVFIVLGFAQARQSPVFLWAPSSGWLPLVLVLTAFAFILLVAAVLPSKLIGPRLRHPGLIALLLWSFAHLLSSGRLAGLVLFVTVFGWSAWALWQGRRPANCLFGSVKKPKVGAYATDLQPARGKGCPITKVAFSEARIGATNIPTKALKLKKVLGIAAAIATGLALWFAFVVQLHTRLIGVPLII